MSADITIVVRMTAVMNNEIRDAAKHNERSIASEIRFRLNDHTAIKQRNADLRAMVDEIKAHIDLRGCTLNQPKG